MTTPLVEVGPDAAVMRIPGVADYRIAPSGSLEVVPAAGSTEADVECLERGPVTALAWLLQGRFALRAAAVASPVASVVLAGPSAVGKSALAAALALRGYRPLADKVVAVVPGPRLLLPNEPPSGLELWPAVAAHLGLDAASGRVVRPALAKRAYRIGTSASLPGTALPPPALVVVMEIDNRLAVPELVDLEGGRDRLHAFVKVQWHRRLVGPLRLGPAHLEWAAEIAAQLRVARLARPRHGMSIAAEADLVEEALAAEGAAVP